MSKLICAMILGTALLSAIGCGDASTTKTTPSAATGTGTGTP
jgi:hypothetical protein